MYDFAFERNNCMSDFRGRLGGRDSRGVSGSGCRSIRKRLVRGGRFNNAAIGGRRRKHFAALMLRSLDLGLGRGYVVVFFQMFQEIADVQEGVAIEADIHKGGLHAGENSCYASFVEATD